MEFSPHLLRQNFKESVADPTLKANLYSATRKAVEKRDILRQADMENWEKLRTKAAAIRATSLDNNNELLDQFRQKFEASGGKVYFAADAVEANRIILDIINQHNGKMVVKGKSMVTEEIELNHALLQQGLEVWETDLGEFIIQLEETKPVHIITPVIHRNRRQIAELFSQKLKMPYNEDAISLTRYARQFLRNKFINADAGITGGNFLVAETGQIVLLSNEGNIRMSSTLPRIHIAVTGIEKVIPALSDMDTILRMLPASATGQKITSYVSFLGAKTTGDDYRKRFVVIVDNNRKKMMAGSNRQMLTCIRCGACLNVCPVFHRGGGHAYGSIYPGPMGIVLTPNLAGFREAPHHPFACSLCGKCDEICPVKIPLSDLILNSRRQVVEAKGFNSETVMWKAWAFVSAKNKLVAFLRSIGRFFPGSINWGLRSRKLPRLAKRSFLSSVKK